MTQLGVSVVPAQVSCVHFVTVHMAPGKPRKRELRAPSVPAPLVVSRAKGAWLWDARGKQLLDLSSGAAPGPLGHQHDEVVAAVCVQAGSFLVTPMGTSSVNARDLTRELVELTALPRVALAATPRLAREAAQRWMARDGGRVLAVAASGAALDPSSIEAAFAESDVRGVIVDATSGVSGVEPLAPEAAQVLAKLCRRHGALLAVDETTAGLGRTGRVWAHEHAGLAPDVIVGVEGLGGGVPVGFLATRAPLDEEPRAPSALACAAASALVKVVRRERLWKVAEATGHELAKRLVDAGVAVAGAGMHLAARVPARLHGDVRERLRDLGVVAVTVRAGWIAVALPLNAGEVEGREAVEALRAALGAAT